ncbi:TPA: antitermination protein NusG [Escherichia coli]|nr:antitermination protein NusG [Escherichia coli]HAM3088686.1 antitermination protein NusG [Escherichia coli]HAM3287912.1 antitermination protein NusG [Escherichia coli]
MAITEREASIIKAIGEETRDTMAPLMEKIAELETRINKLSNEVEGLISLLGEQ